MGGYSDPCLAVDPAAPNTLYAGTEYGVHKSSDGGASWQSASEGLHDYCPEGCVLCPVVTALVIDPTAPNVLYAGVAELGVFKSTDGGTTWQPANSGIGNPGVSSLAIDSNTPSTLYAGTHGGGVYKSTDSGETWQPANEGLPVGVHNSALALVIDPLKPGTVYAATNKGVYKSTEGGASWQPVNDGLDEYYAVRELVIDPAAPEAVYAATGTRVYKSIDGGAS